MAKELLVRAVRRYRFALPVCFALLALLLFTPAQQGTKGDTPSFAGERQYNRLLAASVGSLEDLIARFHAEQDRYIRAPPPEPSFAWNQPVGAIAFDPAGFSDDLLASLTPRMANGVYVYDVTFVQESSQEESRHGDPRQESDQSNHSTHINPPPVGCWLQESIR